MPPQLGLQLLGPPQLYLNNELVTASRRKAVALLAYLAVTGTRQTRDSLSALFWPEYEQSKAFANLRHTLWELQQTVGEGWILAERETIELDSNADLRLDIHKFESMLAKSRAQGEAGIRVSILCDATQLYRNHFLTGFSLKDAPDFNEWAFAKSEDLKHQLAGALVLLSQDYCALGQADQAIPYARRLITLDPLNESSHRLLMQVYIQAGQHSAALKQYQACEQILRKELGVDPQPETRDLYKKIRKREIQPIKIEKQTEKREPSHNLPIQISSFIGREKDQKAIAKLITRHRLVTLIGAGGIGKTRLSLKVGEGLLDQFPDGVWFIELASISDPTLIPQAVSGVFEMVERAGSTLSERLIPFLHARTTLLIFDNCEHLIDACAQLAETLLGSCPRLKILATSREALGLTGEAVYRVPSLSIPKKQDIAQLIDSESIRLFADRAKLTTNEFSLTNDNSQVVAEICRRLDGIPLAIELAAARVNILSVEQIAARLSESFRLLTSGSRTRLERQQTLHASVDWSWDLLSDAERLLLRRLSVFAGGWTLDAAESVCSGEGIEHPEMLDLLTQLVMKSLVAVEQVAGRETRYHLLEIIRQYAHEKMMQADEENKIRTRHLGYFLHLSERAEIEIRGPARWNWLERLNEEANNIRAALHWAHQTDREAGLYISARLRRYWESSSLPEGIHWLETFLHKPESTSVPHARAHALHTYGWLLTWLQQFSKALSVTEESLNLFQNTGDQQREADTLASLANIRQFLDEPDEAVKLLQQSLVLAQSLNDPWREANVHFFLGWDRRDFQKSMIYWEKAAFLYRQTGDQIALANMLGILAQFRVLNGDIELGEKYLEEALLLWKPNDQANIWQNPNVTKSLVNLIRGDYEQAYALLQESLQATKETGNRMSYLWVQVRLGYAALRSGRITEARSIFVQTARDFHKDKYTMGTVFTLEGMAALLITTGKPEKAARLIGYADATREKIHDMRPAIEEADMYRNMAAILSKIGPSGFEVTYDEGRSMTLEQAIMYALEES